SEPGLSKFLPLLLQAGAAARLAPGSPIPKDRLTPANSAANRERARSIASTRILTGAAMYTNGWLARGKYHPISVSILFVLVVAVYAFLFRNYHVNVDVDTPWNLSFSYNYCIKGVDIADTFGLAFPGSGGTIAFGKLAAMVQCAALAPFNWSLVAANV